MDSVMASIPLTVLVPVAYRLVKSKPLPASASKFGETFKSLPKQFKNLALKLSTHIKIMFGFCGVEMESEFLTVLKISFLFGSIK